MGEGRGYSTAAKGVCVCDWSLGIAVIPINLRLPFFLLSWLSSLSC